MLKGKGPHKPEFAYDIVRIHSLMIYTELIEYNIVGDTKGPLLRCFLSISKLKAGDFVTTGQYMYYQTFSNLHSFHIDSRDTSGEHVPSLSVGITRLVLMFKKASNIHFSPRERCKMVASRWVEIPFYRGAGRQQGRRFGEIAQVNGRNPIPCSRNYIIPAAKLIGAEFLQFAWPQTAEVLSGREKFKTATKSVRRQTLRKQLGSGSRNRTASRVIQQNLQNKPVRR